MSESRRTVNAMGGAEGVGGVEARGVEARGVEAGGVEAGGVEAGGVEAGGVEAGEAEAGEADARGADADGARATRSVAPDVSGPAAFTRTRMPSRFSVGRSDSDVMWVAGRDSSHTDCQIPEDGVKQTPS